jgi:calcineurin-like phosphoesterase family protein
MSKIFFTSDLHLYHKNILAYCPSTRTGSDADIMVEHLIMAWNEQVSQDDEVYIIGDLAIGNIEKTRNALYRLNGKLHLIRGNHDTDKLIDVVKDRFESIEHYKKIYINKVQFILFHYPIFEWEDAHKGSIHLHGHTHGRKTGLSGKILDVGIDTRPNYKLYSYEEVIRIMKNINPKERV